MAIGTTAALLGSAALGAGASIYAGNKASGAAQQGAQAGADAQLQAVRESNAMLQNQFNTAWNAGAPWRAAGQQALGSLQSFMGMTPASSASYSAPTSGVPSSGASIPNSGTANPTPVAGAPGGAMQGGSQPVQSSGGNVQQSAMPWMSGGTTYVDFTQPGSIRVSGESNMPWNLRQSQMEDGGVGVAREGTMASNPGVLGGPQAPQPVYAPQTQNAPPAASQVPTSTTPADPNAGFNQFLNSTNYQFTRGEGENALTRLLARTGHLGSGRGQRAALELGQNMAHSNAIMPYMNQLNLMSGLGQNSAMAGGNQAMQLGGMMGNNIMQGGAAAGNALMQGGANRASAYANTGSAINSLFDAFGRWQGYKAGLAGGPP